jgi:hypothetical protein
MIVVKHMGQTGNSFEKRFKEHFLAFKNHNYSSKFSQHILEYGHWFGKSEDIMNTVYYDQKKGDHLDTVEKFYITKRQKGEIS